MEEYVPHMHQVPHRVHQVYQNHLIYFLYCCYQELLNHQWQQYLHQSYQQELLNHQWECAHQS